jgi:chitinase
MKTYIKQFTTLILTAGLASQSFAANTQPPWSANNFSPFVDLTINMHWDSQYQDMEPMDLYAISKTSGVKNYTLAFITDAGSCNPAWGGQATLPTQSGWGLHLLDKLKANQINYTLSLGGQTGKDLSEDCSSTQLTAAYEAMIKTYQPEGIDFDIENTSVNIAKVIHSATEIQHAHPELKIIFTLPTLPEGLVADGQSVVKQAKAANLNYIVNIMAMDYGPAYTNDMGEYAVQAATNVFLFLQTLYPEKSATELWQMIKVTPMIGVNDTNVEKFTLKNVDTLVNFSKQNHLAGIAMWSIARDMPCPDQWASPSCSGDNLQSKPYEFSERFLQ